MFLECNMIILLYLLLLFYIFLTTVLKGRYYSHYRVKKLKLMEVKQLVQDQTTDQCQTWDLNLDLTDTKASLTQYLLSVLCSP